MFLAKKKPAAFVSSREPRSVAVENQESGNTPSASGPGGVGTLLRETRRQQGHDLDTVATMLRIRQPYLQAIEDGRFQDLPGATYAVGFVRGYAEFLSLDSKEIVRRFKQENSEYAARADLVFPSAVSEGSIPTGALLGIAIVAAAAAYGAWYWYQSRGSSVADAVPALPDRLAALIHKPVGNGTEVVPVAPIEGTQPPNVPAATPMQQAPAGQAGQAPVAGGQGDMAQPTEKGAQAAASGNQRAGVESAPTAGAAQNPDQPQAQPQPQPQTQLQTQTQAVAATAQGSGPAAPSGQDAISSAGKVAQMALAQPATPAAPKPETGKAAAEASSVPAETQKEAAAAAPAAEPARGPSRIVLNASENCWIEIRDSTGRIVFTRMLHKGDSYAVPDRPGLTLTVGNAGALTEAIDGKAGTSLGPIGMVRRNLPLDPAQPITPAKEEKPTAEGNPRPGPAPTE